MGLTGANATLSVPVMLLAIGRTVDTADDAVKLFDSRFYVVAQLLLVVPIICGYLTDLLGRHSHTVMVVCGLGLSVLQGVLLVPWDTIVPGDMCQGIGGSGGGWEFCGAQNVLLAVFVLRTVLTTQSFNQMHKMLSIRATKEFPRDELRKEVEIQRTGTMSAMLASVVEVAVFGAALLMGDLAEIQYLLTLVGCATSLVASLLCLQYTPRSFTISRSDQQSLPVETITAKLTDDADSVAASGEDDWHPPGLLGGPETGGYGATDRLVWSDEEDADESEASKHGTRQPGAVVSMGVIEGLDRLEGTDGRGRSGSEESTVSDFKPVEHSLRQSSRAEQRTQEPMEFKRIAPGPRGRSRRGLPVRVAGIAGDDADLVICGQCLCCGVQCVGTRCGSRHTCCGKFLSWGSGLCYFAVTPVIALPFLAYLLMQLVNVIVTVPLAYLEAERFHRDGGFGGGGDTDDGVGPGRSDDALGPVTPPPGSSSMRLYIAMQAIASQLLVRALMHAGGAGAYAAVLAEMKPLRAFRFALPGLCVALALVMVTFLADEREEAASAALLSLTQVISHFLGEFLLWFLIAAVPESLLGLFAIAQGLGLGIARLFGSQLVSWDGPTLVVLAQIILAVAGGVSVTVSFWASTRLWSAKEGHPGEAAGGGMRGGTPTALMHSARLGGYMLPGQQVTEDPEAQVGRPDELFADEGKPAQLSAAAPAATSLSGYHHTG